MIRLFKQRLHFVFGFLLILIALSQGALAAQSEKSLKDAEFQKLQNELNSRYSKEKVVGRFEKEGLGGLTPEDISLTLLSYSYHYTDDSGKPQAFIIAKCSINISRFEKETEELRKQLPPNGPRMRIVLPDSSRTLIGILDVENHKLVTLASPRPSIKPVVRFVKLRKDSPENILITGEQEEDCDDCDPLMEMEIGIVGFDSTDKVYKYIFTAKTYEHVEADGHDGGIGYIDRSDVTWSDWINEYRDLIIIIEREILRIEGDATAGFKNRKEIYSWNDKKELYLVERIEDGRTVLSRSESSRLYHVRQLSETLSKRPSEETALKLIEFIGDSNTMVAVEAKVAFGSYKYKIKDKGKSLSKTIVHALVQKIRNGTPKERKDASEELPLEDIRNLEPEYKKLLLESVNEKESNIALLDNLSLAGVGGKIILPILMKELEQAIKTGDGCQASWILRGIKAIAEQKIGFSRQHISVIKEVYKSPLVCGDGDTEDEVNDILEVLKVR